MSDKTAKIISCIFHPLLMPTYGFIITFNINSLLFQFPNKGKSLLVFFILITTCVLPLMTIYFIKRQGLIKSWNMEDKEERIFPYIISAIFFYFAYRLIIKFQLPSMFYYFLLGSSLLVILSLIINFKWKISSHMVGLGGLTGTFTVLFYKFQLNISYLIAILIVISGLTGYARLKLNSHTHAQIYAGFGLGLVIMTVFLFFLL